MKKSSATRSIDYDYTLPKNLIAQKPASPRDSSRLMILDKKTGRLTHDRFLNLDKYLKPNDLLIFNDTKVIPARLLIPGGEILLLRDLGDSAWEIIGRPMKKLKPNAKIHLDKNTYFTIMRTGKACLAPAATAPTVRAQNFEPLHIKFNLSPHQTRNFIMRHGQTPLPPYIDTDPKTMRQKYQTIYAKNAGSAAAPTAGLHFTKRLLRKISSVRAYCNTPLPQNIAYLTLHVGLGTFQPIRTDDLSAHHMHKEWISIPTKTIRAIRQTKKAGGRMIAVGTTTTRALESIPGIGTGLIHQAPASITRSTDIFITPGYKFKNVDAMITNFHLPKSTLLVMISAFAGGDKIKKAYAEAIRKKYRFYSFGDAMLIM